MGEFLIFDVRCAAIACGITYRDCDLFLPALVGSQTRQNNANRKVKFHLKGTSASSAYVPSSYLIKR